MYKTSAQIKFKTTTLKSSLCDYNDTYIFVKETITTVAQGAIDAAIALDRKNKEVIFKNCT